MARSLQTFYSIVIVHVIAQTSQCQYTRKLEELNVDGDEEDKLGGWIRLYWSGMDLIQDN